MNQKDHWDRIYKTKGPHQLSWYQPHLEKSLALIDLAMGRATSSSAAIVDIGGGESTLVDDLLARGYRNVTVLDISRTAIEETKERLRESAKHVQWLVADVTKAELPRNAYDVWHDRAVFHFLTGNDQRLAYVRNVMKSVKPGGHVIVSTFGPEGPTKCSGLDAVRYDAESLHDQFGTRFRLVESSEELHGTPSGATQQFLYCYCRLE